MAKPKVSINKLGEYMTANSLRRKRIVEEQKNPSTYIVTRYLDAKEIYLNYILSNYDSEIIKNGIEFLENKSTSSEFQASDKSSSLESLHMSIRLTLPDFSNFELSLFKQIGKEGGKIDISGVNVSVMPDIIVRGVYRNKKIVGAIKLHISKSNLLNEEARKNVATVLHQFVEDKLKKDDEKVLPEFCIAIDIFAAKYDVAPKSFINKRNQIKASCEEYALWWEKV